MDGSKPKRRWFSPSPAWLVYGSLAITGLLFLSERFRWFPFNEHKGWTVLIAVAAIGVVLLLMLLWFLAALIFRRRFQFGIRTLLVLTVAVAVAFSWFGTAMKRAKDQKRAAAALAEMRIFVTYHGLKTYIIFGNDGDSREPEWLRSILGIQFFQDVDDVCADTDAALEHVRLFDQLRCLSHLRGNKGDVRITDAGLEHIRDLRRLARLDLDDTAITDAGLQYLRELRQLTFLTLSKNAITDAGLKCLSGLTSLEYLYLDDTQITDAGLKHIAGLVCLERLRLDGTKVTDAGLKNLRRLSRLEELSLSRTCVSDAGLDCLKDLTQLRKLDLSGTNVTNAGNEKLQALLNCDITRNTRHDDFLDLELAALAYRVVCQKFLGSATFAEFAGGGEMGLLPAMDRYLHEDLDWDAVEYLQETWEYTILSRMRPEGTRLLGMFASARNLAKALAWDRRNGPTKACAADQDSSRAKSPMTREGLITWLKDHEMAIRYDEKGEIVEIKRYVGANPFDIGPPPRFSQTVISALAQLPKLERLDLSAAILRDEDFRDVRGFASLKELRLNQTEVSGRVFRAFRDSKSLEVLWLEKIRSIGKGLEAIPVDSLTELDLSGPEIGDDTVRTVVRFRNLRELSLSTPWMKSKTVLSLGQLKKLCKLCLHGYRPLVDHKAFTDLIPRLPRGCEVSYTVDDLPLGPLDR